MNSALPNGLLVIIFIYLFLFNSFKIFTFPNFFLNTNLAVTTLSNKIFLIKLAWFHDQNEFSQVLLINNKKFLTMKKEQQERAKPRVTI